MSKNKTIPNDQDVRSFLNDMDDPQKRKDAFKLLELFQEITNMAPVMWGSAMVGFGQYHYKYKSGREGDMFLTGFSPRKENLTIYVVSGFDRYGDVLQKIGKHKIGKSCFYVKKLADIDMALLAEIVKDSVDQLKKKYA